MLLSGKPDRCVQGIVHRLNSEAPEDRRVPTTRAEEAETSLHETIAAAARRWRETSETSEAAWS